jgi:hypothetical protein
VGLELCPEGNPNGVEPHLLTSTPRGVSRTFPLNPNGEVIMERVVGVGGVFLKARDPKALAAWYREHLGVPVDPGQTYGALASSGPGEVTV